MKKFNLLAFLALTNIFVFCLVSDAAAQRRDHLTSEEIELVRDVQDVDFRMELFAKAIERRIWVLDGVENLTKDQNKRIDKDRDKWGELPAGTRMELFSDIGKILNEAVNKLEDVYEQDPKSDLIPFAYKIIADYSESLIPRLETLAEKSTDDLERVLLENAADQCRDILEVRGNVPEPVGKRKKGKKT